MKFEGQHLEICEDCEKEVPEDYIEGHPDYPLCLSCQSRRTIEHRNSKCELCKKKMGEIDFHYLIDDEKTVAHSDCVKRLSEEKQEEWSDNFDY